MWAFAFLDEQQHAPAGGRAEVGEAASSSGQSSGGEFGVDDGLTRMLEDVMDGASTDSEKEVTLTQMLENAMSSPGNGETLSHTDEQIGYACSGTVDGNEGWSVDEANAMERAGSSHTCGLKRPFLQPCG